MSATVCVIWSSVGRSSGATPTGRITFSISGWYLITPRVLMSLWPPAVEFLRTHWAKRGDWIVSEINKKALDKRLKDSTFITSQKYHFNMFYMSVRQADPTLCFLCFYNAVIEQHYRSDFIYHSRAIAHEWAAVTLQFAGGKGLVNLFNGVGTDHCSAPEQRQREQ